MSMRVYIVQSYMKQVAVFWDIYIYQRRASYSSYLFKKYSKIPLKGEKKQGADLFLFDL
jgi:hypothetical protein